MKNPNEMTLWERFTAPSPKFFKRLMWLGGFLIAVSTPVITTSYITNPVIIKVAGIMNVAGLSIVAVSKLTVDSSAEQI